MACCSTERDLGLYDVVRLQTCTRAIIVLQLHSVETARTKRSRSVGAGFEKEFCAERCGAWPGNQNMGVSLNGGTPKWMV